MTGTMGPSRKEKESFLKVALSAARKTGSYIRREIVRGFRTKTKEDGSFVTNVDTGAEELIRAHIKRAFPEHNVTGGYSADREHQFRNHEHRFRPS